MKEGEHPFYTGANGDTWSFVRDGHTHYQAPTEHVIWPPTVPHYATEFSKCAPPWTLFAQQPPRKTTPARTDRRSRSQDGLSPSNCKDEIRSAKRCAIRDDSVFIRVSAATRPARQSAVCS